MAIALGLHVRCGIEDNLWSQDRKSKMSTVKQIEQLVRISREFGREVANGKEAKKILKIDTFYSSIEETLEKNGFAPNRKPSRHDSNRHRNKTMTREATVLIGAGVAGTRPPALADAAGLSACRVFARLSQWGVRTWIVPEKGGGD